MVWEFLKEAARVNPITLNRAKIILGNESCDLDSTVSSIVYAYVLTCIAETNPSIGTAIPVMNIEKEDFELKTEVVYFLKKCGVPVEALLFRDTMDLNVLQSLEITLVDHHSLSERDLKLKPFVTEVVDHRPLDPEWTWENIRKKIEPVGACATLIAEVALDNCVCKIPQEILHLLYGTIILDTACLSEDPKKYNQKDLNIICQLEKFLIEKPDCAALYKELLSVRNDISNLSLLQILKKDMKTACDIPVSTVPLLIKDFLALNGAEAELHRFASSSRHKAVVVLGVSCSDGNYRRELAIYGDDPSVLLLLTNALKNNKSPNLELKEIKAFRKLEKINVFNQQNTQAFRKQVLPVVKQAVTSWIVSHGSTN